MSADKFDVDDRVKILVGGPHENFGRIATVGRVQDDGDVVVYFGDQDEDEWVYSPNELARREPGLHRVGPNPWDYEYNPAKGQRVSFVDTDGKLHSGTVTDFVEDEETGELRLTVDPDDEEPKPS